MLQDRRKKIHKTVCNAERTRCRQGWPGVLIGEYIQVFDSVLKVFLNNLPYIEDACSDAEKEYITLMQKVHAII